jgi:uncharacterized membrane protein YoaT (DUF817 family)
MPVLPPSSRSPARPPSQSAPRTTGLVSRLRLLLQIPATLAILAWLPGNASKLLALLVLWLLTFGPIRQRERVLYATACLFFTGMNALSLRQGIFSFSRPDLLGMPLYELFMWGFYLLHSWRVLGGPAPQGRQLSAWILALLYAAAFGGIADGNTLLAVSGLLLLGGLALFHTPQDLAYVAYLVALGAAIEYTGVYSGQWNYPGHPLTGVPLWFVTLWGGVGLFLHRLIVPLLEPGVAPPRD